MLPAIVKSAPQQTTTSSNSKVLDSSLIEETVRIIKEIRQSKLFDSIQGVLDLQPCSNIPLIFVIILVVLFVMFLLLVVFFFPRVLARLEIIFDSKIDRIVASKLIFCCFYPYHLLKIACNFK